MSLCSCCWIETRSCSWPALQVKLPSGKHTKNYVKSPCFMGKSTISMAIFNSYVNLPEGNQLGIPGTPWATSTTRTSPWMKPNWPRWKWSVESWTSNQVRGCQWVFSWPGHPKRRWYKGYECYMNVIRCEVDNPWQPEVLELIKRYKKYQPTKIAFIWFTLSLK